MRGVGEPTAAALLAASYMAAVLLCTSRVGCGHPACWFVLRSVYVISCTPALYMADMTSVASSSGSWVTVMSFPSRCGYLMVCRNCGTSCVVSSGWAPRQRVGSCCNLRAVVRRYSMFRYICSPISEGPLSVTDACQRGRLAGRGVLSRVVILAMCIHARRHTNPCVCMVLSVEGRWGALAQILACAWWVIMANYLQGARALSGLCRAPGLANCGGGDNPT